MNINGKHYRTIWIKEDDPRVVQAINQELLPYEFKIINLTTVEQVIHAISSMQIRGAGLIGATAGWGMYIAALRAPRSNRKAFLDSLTAEGEKLKATRPTAINLEWAVRRQIMAIKSGKCMGEMTDIARRTAQAISDEDAEYCRRIGEHGLALIDDISRRKKGGTVNILTHCNAGWLAFVDYGTATAPIYAAYNKGIKLHVWVDETRPRNQGARLTAWELLQHGVPFTVIADNAGGHLMQHGMVDMVITGSDRTTCTGDVTNKIGTYLKALAANDNNVPFYVALPSSSFDWKIRSGLKEIPIEQRNAREVTHIDGLLGGNVVNVRLTPKGSQAANYGFDVTPARLVTGLITERGICRAEETDILELYPEHRRKQPKPRGKPPIMPDN